MRHLSPVIMFVAAIVLLPVQANAATFDGTWSVTQECEPSPGGARGFKWAYDATVKGGRLLGQYGTKDKPSSLTLAGQIQPDGSASLRASGLTGHSDYTAGFGQPGEKFNYPVEARFEAKRGTGIRTQARICRFTFEKR